MKLITLSGGIAVGVWVLLRTMREARRTRQLHRPKETIARWEGEGGAIPEVQTAQSTVPGNTRGSA